MITVQGRSLARRRPLFEDFSVPPPATGGGDAVTLRELIAVTVRHQVEAFRQRQQDRQFLRVLTEREILDGAAVGKVDASASDVPPAEVDVEEAIARAIQAFEDGIYLIAIDENDCRDLDAQIFLRPDSRITFIRLTLLAGG